MLNLRFNETLKYTDTPFISMLWSFKKEVNKCIHKKNLITIDEILFMCISFKYLMINSPIKFFLPELFNFIEYIIRNLSIFEFQKVYIGSFYSFISNIFKIAYCRDCALFIFSSMTSEDCSWINSTSKYIKHFNQHTSLVRSEIFMFLNVFVKSTNEQYIIYFMLMKLKEKHIEDWYKCAIIDIMLEIVFIKNDYCHFLNILTISLFINLEDSHIDISLEIQIFSLRNLIKVVLNCSRISDNKMKIIKNCYKGDEKILYLLRIYELCYDSLLKKCNINEHNEKTFHVLFHNMVLYYFIVRKVFYLTSKYPSYYYNRVHC